MTRIPDWYRALCAFGVTGTNGKTSTSLFLNAILSAEDHGAKEHGAEDEHSTKAEASAEEEPSVAVTTVGFFRGPERLPLELSAPAMDRVLRECVQRGGKRCVLELSSEALTRGFLRRYPVSVGVFTNLSHDHLDAHHSPEHYLASKAQLFLSLPPQGTAVLNAADPNSALLAEVLPPGVRLIEYGVASRGEVPERAALRAARVEVSLDGTRLQLHPHPLLGGVTELELCAIGEVFAENALGALGAALAAGTSAETARAVLARTPAPPGRFEVVHRHPTVVIDYAHTPDALSRTLQTARRVSPGRVLVVFGAGGERDRDKRPAMGRAAQDADRIVLTSDNPRSEDPRAIAQAITAGLEGHSAVTLELDRRRAIELALRECDTHDVVVIAGKGHETTQLVGGEVRHFSDREVVAELLGVCPSSRS